MPALQTPISDLGRMIRAARKGAGMRQDELADRLSVSQGTVSRWESRGQLPEAKHMHVLVSEFGVDPHAYFAAAAAIEGDGTSGAGTDR